MFGRAADILRPLLLLLLALLATPAPGLLLMMLPLLAGWYSPVGSTMDTLFGPAVGVTTDIVLLSCSCLVKILIGSTPDSEEAPFVPKAGESATCRCVGDAILVIYQSVQRRGRVDVCYDEVCRKLRVRICFEG